MTTHDAAGPRHPDQILADFDAGARGERDIDMRAVLWEVINDVLDTVKSNGYFIFQRDIESVDRLIGETIDYLTNHYGDDTAPGDDLPLVVLADFDADYLVNHYGDDGPAPAVLVDPAEWLIDHTEPYIGPTVESSEACDIAAWGHDINGDDWRLCKTHGYMVLGDTYVCEGYVPPPYQERGAAAPAEQPPVVVVVRDPDASNEFHVFGDATTVDIDLGYMDLHDPGEWEEWRESVETQAAVHEAAGRTQVADLIRQIIESAREAYQ